MFHRWTIRELIYQVIIALQGDSAELLTNLQLIFTFANKSRFKAGRLQSSNFLIKIYYNYSIIVYIYLLKRAMRII